MRLKTIGLIFFIAVATLSHGCRSKSEASHVEAIAASEARSFTRSANWWVKLAEAEANLASDLEDNATLLQPQQVTALSEQVFADYMNYVKNVGILLAGAQQILVQQQQGASLGITSADQYCTEKELTFWNTLAVNALSSDFSAFKASYCDRGCIDPQSLWSTYANPVSCEEEARELYNAFSCDDSFLSSHPHTNHQPIPPPPFPAAVLYEAAEEQLCYQNSLTSNSCSVDNIQLVEDNSISLISHMSGLRTKNRFGIAGFDGIVSLSDGRSPASSKLVRDFVGQKVKRCELSAQIKLDSHLAPDPNSFATLIDNYDLNIFVSDPVYPTLDQNTNSLLAEIESQVQANCEIAHSEQQSFTEQMMVSYRKIRFDRILMDMGHYSLGDMSGAEHTIEINGEFVKHSYNPEYLNAILEVTDGFFIPIIKEMDSKNLIAACAQTSATPLEPEEEALQQAVNVIKSLFTGDIFVGTIGGNLPVSTPGSSNPSLTPQELEAIQTGNLTQDQRDKILSKFSVEKQRELQGYFVAKDSSRAMELITNEALGVLTDRLTIVGSDTLKKTIVAIKDKLPGGVSKGIDFFLVKSNQSYMSMSDEKLPKKVGSGSRRVDKVSDAAKGLKFSENQIDRMIDKKLNKCPDSIIRLDKVTNQSAVGSQSHIVFDRTNGPSLNKDGSWRGSHGEKRLTNKEKEFLRKIGWKLPADQDN